MSNIYVDGVFDLLHLGHIDLFKTIKGEKDKLIVGVINDKNVQSYKRLPVQSLHQRAEMLRNIKIVDAVIEDCPFGHISLDFLNKYNITKVFYGGKVSEWSEHYKVATELNMMYTVDYVSPDISTSEIIKKIKQEY